MQNPQDTPHVFFTETFDKKDENNIGIRRGKELPPGGEYYYNLFRVIIEGAIYWDELSQEALNSFSGHNPKRKTLSEKLNAARGKLKSTKTAKLSHLRRSKHV